MRITQQMVDAYINDDDALLHALLGLAPWEENPLDADGEYTGPPGTAAALSFPQAQELRRQLEALAAARRKR